MTIFMRLAESKDMPFIKEKVKDFRLDDEDIDCRQFIVAVEGDEIVGFGRIRPHNELYELGCVGVVEDRRNQGIGKMIVEHLINIFPAYDVYINTDLTEYFEGLGFRKIDDGHGELVEKTKKGLQIKVP